MTRRSLVEKGLLGAGAALAFWAPATQDLPAAVPAPRHSRDKGAFDPFTQHGLTHYIAEFVVNTAYAGVPATVIESGKKSILDGLGLALVGSVVKTGDLIQKYLKSLGLSRSTATVIGTPMKVAPRFAAFVNGIGIHSEDYDDTQAPGGPRQNFGLLHPTDNTLPVAIAYGETRGMSGRDLMLAYHLGVEVECKICQAINPRHYIDGFHTTGTCGTFGAATVAAKLLGLDPHWTANAFGIAGAEASGLRANFGTMTKPFQAGHAAESGTIAGDLAALGWTASLDILEDPGGFFHAAGGGYDPAYIMGRLGNPWTFASPGIAIKPFPSGLVTHPGMTGMLNLIKENHIRANEVESVTVGVNAYVPKDLFYHDPQTALQAKFSMEFCIASLLLYGKAGLNQFQDSVVKSPEVQAMMKGVRLVIDPRSNAPGVPWTRTYLTVRLRDGRTISGHADYAKGTPQNRMSYDEVAAKFHECTDFTKWPKPKAKAIVEMVSRLETVSNVGALTALLSA